MMLRIGSVICMFGIGSRLALLLSLRVSLQTPGQSTISTVTVSGIREGGKAVSSLPTILVAVIQVSWTS